MCIRDSIGTHATVNSGAYVHAIRALAPDVHTVSAACPLFVPLAEEGWVDHQATRLIAKEYLFPLTLEKIDTLILGCTHYPLLAPAIAGAVGPGVMLIDSGEAAAAEVERQLEEHGIRNTSTERPHLQFYVSDIPAKFAEIGELFLGQSLSLIHISEPTRPY